MSHSVTFGRDGSDEGGGFAAGFLVSLVIHALIIGTILLRHKPEVKTPEKPVEFVELVDPKTQAPVAKPLQQQATPSSPDRVQVYTEAPGAATKEPVSPNAPLSNANRRATTPDPRGTRPTTRPGPGGGMFIPADPTTNPKSVNEPDRAPNRNRGQTETKTPSADSPDASSLRNEIAGQAKPNESNSPVDWGSAIQDLGRVASIGGGSMGQIGGNDGIAETGPISFETQWFEWGDYADGMVRRIRYHWYNNMPELIRIGVKGVVVIRFTIHRSGRISEVTILRSSGSPPYDFAAKKAIELSSPLAPLPEKFPKETEHVTAAFYYNMSPPQ